MRIDEALQWGRQQLAATSDAPDLDTNRLLLATLHQTETSWLAARPELELTPAKASVFESLIAQRAAGEPLAYLIGKQEFYGREFTVTPAVLIPRPETEELIRQAKTVIADLSAQRQRPLIVADIGTGSGCIAITLALELLSSQLEQIYATDISPAAIAIAQDNARQYGVSETITFFIGNMLDPLAGKQIDLIVSNPPYVPTDELEHSLTSSAPDKKGLQFEPRVALDGGPDGQLFINQLKTIGIPLLVEGLNGEIFKYNF